MGHQPRDCRVPFDRRPDALQVGCSRRGAGIQRRGHSRGGRRRRREARARRGRPAHSLTLAFARLREEYPQAHLEIAGSGDLGEELKAHAKRLNLGDSVTFSGFVNPIEAMGRSDMIVQLSVWENCSYTLLDAKAAGLKTVATAVGGNPEILNADELVDRQSPKLTEEVLQAMRRQLQKGDTEPFTWISNEQMAAQTVDIYARVLRGGRR